MKVSSRHVRITFLAVAAVLAVLASIIYVGKQHTAEMVKIETLRTEKIVISKEEDGVTIYAEVPQFFEGSREFKQTNVTLRAQVEAHIKDAVDGDYMPLSHGSVYQSSFTVDYSDNKVLGVLYTGMLDVQGAAHPLPFLKTFVVDRVNDKVVAVENLFKDSSYLDLLSKLSREDLYAQVRYGDGDMIPDKAMIESGTEPIKENFSNMIPTADGLLIYFPVYQVAPYAAGVQQVAVPYKKLASVIRGDGPLSHLIK